MRFVDLIAKKRNGEYLNKQEIDYIVSAYVKGDIPDYQMSAWLMSVYFQGMTMEETAELTMAMAASGCMVDLSAVPGIKVDKHSTGGVADTTTLILAPLVAAAGVPVAKMSGRGLGFTGGTIDKLESIAGFSTTLTRSRFVENLREKGIAITGQSDDIAPADGKIYALRDVTATVESIPLIASSIMSKKIAAGADKILLDVKVGRGAFMKQRDQAIRLAETMVHIGNLVKRETVAILTNMDEPLGQAVGNSLEVREAVDILSGRGSIQLRDVCLYLGAHMLVMGCAASNIDSGYKIMEDTLASRAGIEKLRELILAQGGDGRIVDNPDLLPQATYQIPLVCENPGFVKTIEADRIGYAAMILGAGRQFKGQNIDLAAGLMLHCRVGDQVEAGQTMAVIHANEESRISQAVSCVQEAICIDNSPQSSLPLILGKVDSDGFQNYL